MNDRPPSQQNSAYDPEAMADYWIQTITPTLRAAFLAGYKAKSIAYAEEEANIQPPRPSTESTYIPEDQVRAVQYDDNAVFYVLPHEEVPPEWRMVYHVRGNHPCRKPALFVTRLLEDTEKIKTSLIRRLNGKPVQPDEPAFCGSCRQELVAPFSSNDLDWNAVIIKRPKTVTFFDPEDDAPIIDAADVLKTIEEKSFEPYELPAIPNTTPDEQATLRQIAEDVGYVRS